MRLTRGAADLEWEPCGVLVPGMNPQRYRSLETSQGVTPEALGVVPFRKTLVRDNYNPVTVISVSLALEEEPREGRKQPLDLGLCWGLI